MVEEWYQYHIKDTGKVTIFDVLAKVRGSVTFHSRGTSIIQCRRIKYAIVVGPTWSKLQFSMCAAEQRKTRLRFLDSNQWQMVAVLMKIGEIYMV